MKLLLYYILTKYVFYQHMNKISSKTYYKLKLYIKEDNYERGRYSS